MQTNVPVWKQLLHIRRTSPLLFRTLLLLLSIELFAICIAPLLLPKHLYLDRYLSNKAKTATADFLHNPGFLIPDPVTGWKNKPNTARDNWQVDQFGSRSHHPIAQQSSKPIRVLFIGSSMINGGSHIHNNETLSAWLEDPQIEALNFGTMLYSFDQSLLKLQQLLSFNPDIVIMGLDSDPVSGLTNLYIPFRNPNEINMPFMKPRYILNDNDQLQLLEFQPVTAIQQLQENDTVLNQLRAHDAYYHRFNRFIHFGQTPIAGGLNFLLRKTESLIQYQSGNPEGETLLLYLMQKAQSLAGKQHFQLIFLSMPSVSNIRQSRLLKYFPDWYELRQQTFKKLSLPVVDVKPIFLASNQPLDMLYTEDHVHFTAIGNKIIADNLRKKIHSTPTHSQN